MIKCSCSDHMTIYHSTTWNRTNVSSKRIGNNSEHTVMMVCMVGIISVLVSIT